MKNDDFGDRMKLQSEALSIATEFENPDNITFSEAGELACHKQEHKNWGSHNNP